jgi:hypothetical protein
MRELCHDNLVLILEPLVVLTSLQSFQKSTCQFNHHKNQFQNKESCKGNKFKTFLNEEFLKK